MGPVNQKCRYWGMTARQITFLTVRSHIDLRRFTILQLRTRQPHASTVACGHPYARTTATYSCLSASIGFMRAARWAGYSPAANPTKAETPVASSTVTSETLG
jgi:hypothetical protein